MIWTCVSWRVSKRAKAKRVESAGASNKGQSRQAVISCLFVDAPMSPQKNAEQPTGQTPGP